MTVQGLALSAVRGCCCILAFQDPCRRWLVAQGQTEQARLALAKLRAPGELEEEFRETTSAAVDLKSQRGIAALKAPEVREELFLGASHISTGLHNRMIAMQKKTCYPVTVTWPGLLCRIRACTTSAAHSPHIEDFCECCFSSMSSLRLFLAGIGLQILQQACGINTVKSCPAHVLTAKCLPAIRALA